MSGDGDKYRDSLFARLVLKEKLLSKEKVEKLLKETKYRQKKGESVTLAALMVDRGMISEDQREELNRFLQKEIVTCPQCNAPYDAKKYSEGKEFSCKKCGAKITIQKAFSDSFQTTIKFGALPKNVKNMTDQEIQDFVEDAAQNASPGLEPQQPPEEEGEGSQEEVADEEEEFHSAPTVIERGPANPKEGSGMSSFASEEEAEEDEEWEEVETGGSAGFSSESPTVVESPATPAGPGGPSISTPSQSPMVASGGSGEMSSDVELPKVVAFSYYERMRHRGVYPLHVSFPDEETRGVVRVRAQVPGSITIPDYQDVSLTEVRDQATFWVMPLMQQKSYPAEVQVWHNSKVARTNIPARITGPALSRLFAFLFVVFGAFLGYIFYAFSSVEKALIYAKNEYIWEGWVYGLVEKLTFIENMQQAGQYGLYFLGGLTGFFFLLSLVFWLLSKPKMNTITQGLKYDD